MPTIPDAMQVALRHHQAGDWQRAEQIYRQVLNVAPEHADAWHLLGVLAHQLGKHALAVEYIGRAVALDSFQAIFHNNLGEAHRALGQLSEAEASYRQALRLHSNYAEAHNNLSFLLKEQGRLDEALASSTRALRLLPDFAEAHNNHGLILKEQGRPDEALASFQRALGLKPDLVEAHNNRGLILREQGRRDEARASFQTALRLWPEFVEAANNLGLVLKEQNQLVQARDCFQNALRLRPDYAEAHNNLGLVLALQGRRDEALACFQQALRLRPNWTGARLNLGLLYQEQGRLDLARSCYREALRLDPDFLDAHINLGNVLKEQGKLEEASACYRHALRINPDSIGALNNLGNVLKDEGRFDEARECYQQAHRLRPDSAETHINLGNLLKVMKRLDEARACYQEAVRLKPEAVGALINLGLVHKEQGRLDEARACYQEAARQQPDCAEAHNNLGIVFKEQNRFSEALTCYQEALRLQPDMVEARLNLGNVLKDLGRFAEALASYQQAVRQKPDSAEALYSMGNLLRDRYRLPEALASYQQALSLKPDYADVHNSLGNIFADQGLLDEARASFERALALDPHDGLRIKSALLLPVIAPSLDDIARQRGRLQEKIARLLHQDLAVDDPVYQVGIPVFYLAYQGLNDRDLQADLAKLFLKTIPSLSYVAPHCSPSAHVSAGTRPIRVGFVSKFFHDHVIGKFYSGVIRNFSREAFHVTVFRFPGNDDATARSIEESADSAVTLPPYLAAAREKIAEQKLDVLFYTDIGMDPWTYYLAFARLAPVQCTSSGHPVTTGIPTIDYFLSDVDLEPANADEHYSERLVRLEHFPFYFHARAPRAATRTRADFGLDEGAHLYMCSQTLFKVHPEFDGILGEILRADPRGQVVLFKGSQAPWTDLLLERFRRTIPHEVDRVRFLPRQGLEDFLQAIALADVLVDTIHFSGGTSSFEAFSAGTPIVTLPGATMRGRVTYACYRKMGVMDCVARDREDYVQKAVRLGTDPAYRAAVRAKIFSAKDVLYDNPAGVRALEQFFSAAVERARGQGNALPALL